MLCVWACRSFFLGGGGLRSHCELGKSSYANSLRFKTAHVPFCSNDHTVSSVMYTVLLFAVKLCKTNFSTRCIFV